MLSRRDPLVLVALLAIACGPGLLGDDLGADDTGSTGPGKGSSATHGKDDHGNGKDDEGEAESFPGEVGEVDSNGEDDEAGEQGESGVMVGCGDGVLAEGELCDDGNDAQGDGCEPDCTVTAGMLLWAQTFDGAGADDNARDVAAGNSGEIIVAGSMEIADSDDAWVHVFAPDGSWIIDSRLDLGSDERATSVTITSAGDAFIAGVQPGDDRALLLFLDGDVLFETGGAPTDIATFTALASTTAEGFVMVTHAGGFDNLSATARRFDAVGSLLGDVPQQAGVFVGAAIPSSEGGTILGGGTFGMDVESSVWLASLGADGSAAWSSSGVAEPGVTFRLRGLATASDGRIVGVGTRGFGGMMDEDDAGWIWWWTPDGIMDSDGPLDIGGAAARPNAVVVGTHGLVVGGTTLALEDGFVAGLTFDGALQWGYEVAGDLGLEDGVVSVALVPGFGVAAAGWVTQSTTGEDAWVGMFTE